MINDIPSINDKIMNELYTQTTQARKTLDKLNQSQARDYGSTEDASQLRASYRKARGSDTQSLSSEGQSSLESTLQKMRSLSNKAAAEGAAQAADSTRTSKSGESIADSLSKQQNMDIASAHVSGGGETVPTANIQATGSGNYVADTNMGNEVSDFSRFNAIAQQGAAMLSRDNAVSGQSSNVSTEATAAASNSQVSEASSAMASRATSQLESAISRVTSTRSTLGATQNRLESTIANLSKMESNLSDEEKKIRDADLMASEMVNFSRNSILLNPGIAMLGQANSAPQQVLQLLGG